MSLHSKYLTTALGFLPEACLKSLPPPLANSYLQTLIDNLPIPDGHQFRRLVDAMQFDASIEEYLLSAPQPESDYLYAVFTLISQKYIWGCGPDHLLSTLPKQIGVPLLAASKKTGLPPVLTYASSVLWNWSLKDETKPFCLENLQLNHKISEGLSFEWFFIIHVAIEGICGFAVDKMIAVKEFMKKGDNEAIKEVIKEVIKATILANDTLLRMREHCVPEEFWQFRMYLSGTQDPTFFPKGLQVEGVDGTDLSFRGASGTQSSLIQALDSFYSIKHGSHEESFFNESKLYMPPAHRKYLEDLATGLILRDYVERSNDMDLKSIFRDGVATLEKLRKSHVGIVHSYIVKFMKPKDADASPGKKEVNVFGENGSGGTNFRILLNNISVATGQGKELNSFEKNSNGKGEKEVPVVKKVFSVEKGTMITFFKYLLMIIVSMLALRLFRTYLTNDVGIVA